jgi:hypothetical protein
MGSVLAIAQLVSALLPQALALITNAIQAAQTNDQATLDRLHAQALAAANALRPTGADPLA